jgi:hypothetical protein
MRKVITNVPVVGYARIEVEIPDDIAEEDLQEALAAAVSDTPCYTLAEGLYGKIELDDSLLDHGWVLEVESD